MKISSIYSENINFYTFYPKFKGSCKTLATVERSYCMGGSTKSQKAGRLKRLEAKIVKKPASYRDYVET